MPQGGRKPEPKVQKGERKKSKAAVGQSAEPKAETGKIIRVRCPHVGSRQMSSRLGVGESFANPMKGGHRCTVCLAYLPSATHPVVR